VNTLDHMTWPPDLSRSMLMAYAVRIVVSSKAYTGGLASGMLALDR